MIFRTKLFLQSTRFFAPTGFSCPFGPAFQGSGYRLHCCQGNNRSAALPIRRRLLPSPTGKVVTVYLEPCLSSLFPSAKKKIVTVCPDTPANRPCKHKFRFNKETFYHGNSCIYNRRKQYKLLLFSAKHPFTFKKNGNSLSGIQESNGFPCLFHSRPVDSPQKPSQFSFSSSPSIFLFLKDLKSAAQKPSHFSRRR